MELKVLGNLSPTKLEQARLCEARLVARVGDDEYEEEKGDQAKVGTLAHAAAKFWYRRGLWVDKANEEIIDLEKVKPDPEIHYWIETTTPDIAFDWAMKECALNKNFKGEPDSQMPPPEGVGDARSMFQAIAAQYNRDVVKVVAAERRYKGTLRGVPIHLIIDLILDRGNDKIEIVDFKTGHLTCTTDEMRNKDQVMMNLVAVSNDPSLAHYKYRDFTYFWVRKGFQTGPVTESPDRLRDYETFLMYEYQRMLDIKDPKENLNDFCWSCGRRQKCKKWTEHVSEAMTGNPKAYTPEEANAIGDEELLEMAFKINSQKKLLEDRFDSLKSIVLKRVQQSGKKKLEGEKFAATMTQRADTYYSSATVLSLCQRKGIDIGEVMKVQKGSVDSIFGSDEQAMSELMYSQVKIGGAAYVVIRAKAAKKRSGKDAAAEQEGAADES